MSKLRIQLRESILTTQHLCIGWVGEALDEGLANNFIASGSDRRADRQFRQAVTKMGHQTTRTRKNRNNNPRTIPRNPEISQQFPNYPKHTVMDGPTVTVSDV